ALAGIREALARGPVAVRVQVPGVGGAPLAAKLDFVDNAVDTGTGSAGRIVIDKGLAGGERVVTDGQLLLVDGSHVQVVAG
ncbi:MAG TPA: hypothetical protein VFM52_06410, partial [Rhodanobacter sp.]|nr:hypothetical protein [Rhodanobacter sp.]